MVCTIHVDLYGPGIALFEIHLVCHTSSLKEVNYSSYSHFTGKLDSIVTW